MSVSTYMISVTVMCIVVSVVAYGIGKDIVKQELYRELNGRTTSKGENMPEIIYDFNDAVKFIKKSTALDEETIIKILDAEEGYMRKIGIMQSE